MEEVVRPLAYLASPVALAAVTAASTVLLLSGRHFAKTRRAFSASQNAVYLVGAALISAVLTGAGLGLDRVVRMPFAVDAASADNAAAVEPSTVGWTVIFSLAAVSVCGVCCYLVAAVIAARDLMLASRQPSESALPSH